MNPDLREGEGDAAVAAVADEDSAAESRVAWYFGDLLDTVVSEYPVARHRLVGVLAALEAAASGQAPVVEERSEAVGGPKTPGQVLRLPLQLWDVFAETEELSADELRAARAVHRRMAVALEGEEPDPAAPYFVFAADPPY